MSIEPSKDYLLLSIINGCNIEDAIDNSIDEALVSGAVGFGLGALGHYLYSKVAQAKKRQQAAPPKPDSKDEETYSDEEKVKMTRELVKAVGLYSSLSAATSKKAKEMKRRGEKNIAAFEVAARNEALTKAIKKHPKIRIEWLIWALQNLENEAEGKRLASLFRITPVHPPFYGD